MFPLHIIKLLTLGLKRFIIISQQLTNKRKVEERPLKVRRKCSCGYDIIILISLTSRRSINVIVKLIRPERDRDTVNKLKCSVITHY